MPTATVTTKFYTFNQNNSGGLFEHDESAGIGYSVAIEATSAKDALRRAEDIGIYFNGCDAGLDCSCCGDRWSDWMDESDGTETPTNGYGEGSFKGGWGIPSYIHYMDGRIEAVPDSNEGQRD